MLFTLFLVWRFAVDDALALGLPRWVLLTFVAGAYVASLLVYQSVRRSRRGREGLELEVVYRPLPDD